MLAYRRTPYGYLSADKQVFLERGARMTDGWNAWLIWFSVRPQDIWTDDGRTYGNHQEPLARLDEIAGVEHAGGSGGVLMIHLNDAGSLAEAKQTAAAILTARAAS